MTQIKKRMKISNDDELRELFKQLDETENRIVGAMLVNDVLPLTKDARVKKAIKKAIEREATVDELSDEFKSLKRVMLENKISPGFNGDWDDQASDFVIRAASAVVTPKPHRDTVDPLWQIVQSCRMARSCTLIGSSNDSDNPEAENQYKIVNKYLKENLL